MSPAPQWQSTADHMVQLSPAAQTGQWQSTADHNTAPANFDFNKALAAQPDGIDPHSPDRALADQGFLSSAWNTLKGALGANLGPASSMVHGAETLADMKRASDLDANGTDEQKREFAKEQLLKSIPFYTTARKLYLGNLPGAVGDVAGGYAAGAALGAGVGAVKGMGALEKGSRAFEVDPAVALAKAHVLPGKPGFLPNLPDAMADIKDAAPVTSNASLRFAAGKAMEKNQAALEDLYLKPARDANLTAHGGDIADATANAIPTKLKVEQPSKANFMQKQAERAYNRDFTVDQLRDLLREKNADLEAFYDKSPVKQQAAVASGNIEAVVKAQRDAIANVLYRALDPETGGEGPREIQARYGAIQQIAKEADQRIVPVLAEKSVSDAGKIGGVAAGISNLPGKFFHGEMEQGLAGITKPLAGTSDPLIKRAFDTVGPARPFPQRYQSQQ